MAIVESMRNDAHRGREKGKYQVTFLRFGKKSDIKILEIVEAEDAEDALNIALGIAEKAKWHIEKVERMNEIQPAIS